MKTLVTGGTGFVGRNLLAQLKSADVVSRNAASAASRISSNVDQVIQWNPSGGTIELTGRPKYRVVVNLMGESIAEGRWTHEKKKRIHDSRVIGTRNLIDSLVQSQQLPEVLVSTSAVGLYGDPGETIVTEDHEAGTGFLPNVCEAWEAEANRISKHGVRVVNLRVGIVLGRGGGALAKMLPMFRFGLGGKLGNGTQWMPWIHVADLVNLICWSINSPSISGPVNAVAPNPVRNAHFTKALANAVNRPAILPAPKFVLRIVLGEFAESLFFSQRVIPQIALTNGFNFRFSDLDSALHNITTD